MRNLVWIAILLICRTAAGQDRKEVPAWQSLLLGTWTLDSTSVKFPEWMWPQSFMDLSHFDDDRFSLQFLANGKVINFDSNTCSIEPYECFFSGSDDKYILRQYGIWRIDHLSEGYLILTQPGYKSGNYNSLETRHYFSRSSKQMELLQEELTGDYIIYQREQLTPMPDSVKRQVLLSLDTNGNMVHIFDTEDKGRWSIDSNLNLQLEGEHTSRNFSIVFLDNGKIGLRDLTSDNDSVLILRNINPLLTEAEREAKRLWDSVVRADPIYQDLAKRNEIYLNVTKGRRLTLRGKWTPIVASNVKLKLVIKDDGTVVYKMGRKKYKGTWRYAGRKSDTEWHYVILEWNGVKQIAAYQLGYGFDTNTNFVSRELELLFLPPNHYELMLLRLTSN